MFAFIGSLFVSILFLQEDSAPETSLPSFLKGIHQRNKERKWGRGGFSLAEWGGGSSSANTQGNTASRARSVQV